MLLKTAMKIVLHEKDAGVHGRKYGRVRPICRFIVAVATPAWQTGHGAASNAEQAAACRSLGCRGECGRAAAGRSVHWHR